MERSGVRILTTHVGSLVRPGAVAEVLRAESLGQAFDRPHSRRSGPAVAEVVRKQAEIGVDVPSDGEFGKTMDAVRGRASGRHRAARAASRLGV